MTLAGLISERKKRVLLVDTDPHASLSTYLNFDSEQLPASLFDLFQLQTVNKETVSPLIVKTQFENIDLIPAHMSLATLDRVMGNRGGMGLVLKKSPECALG